MPETRFTVFSIGSQMSSTACHIEKANKLFKDRIQEEFITKVAYRIDVGEDIDTERYLSKGYVSNLY
jgi:hypothetical protein